MFAVFIVCHLVGDFLLQTDWQATNKPGGLGGDSLARRALTAHALTYTLAFAPVVVWLALDRGAWALLVAPAIAVPHIIQDDGRLVRAYTRKVKGCDAESLPTVIAAVDQSFHMLALLAVALIAGR